MLNSRRIMISGASGFLGMHLAAMLRERGFDVVCFTHKDLEITDPEAVRTAVCGCRPDVVVNCAAISSTGYAKDHPEESMAINVQGPVNIARACLECGSSFYTMSSDQVYGGCALSIPLPEDLDLAPNNVYGQHKLLMEKEVLSVLPSAVVLRLSWMFEAYDAARPHVDMVSRIAGAVQRGECIKASTKELRGITCVDDVCDNIIRSFGILPGGVYNFGAGNTLDSYHTLANVFRAKGYPSELVVPDDSWGRNLSMDCSKLDAFGISFRGTEESLVSVL